MFRFIKGLTTREEGATAPEYAVMTALIVVVCVSAVSTVGEAVNATFVGVGNSMAVNAGVPEVTGPASSPGGNNGPPQGNPGPPRGQPPPQEESAPPPKPKR